MPTITSNMTIRLCAASILTLWVAQGSLFAAGPFQPIAAQDAEPSNGYVRPVFQDQDGAYGFENDDDKTGVPWAPSPPPEAARLSGPGPLASEPFLARLLGGDWQLTLQSGTSMLTRWSAGPGEHSFRSETRGFGGGGEPWRSLRVLYRDPQSQDVRLFGLSSYAQGVSEGTIEFDGETAEGQYVLHQERNVHRNMGLRWSIGEPEEFRSILLETEDSGEVLTLGEWSSTRVPTSTQAAGHALKEAPGPSAQLAVFEPFLGQTYGAACQRSDEQPFQVRSTLEFVPYADYVRVQTFAHSQDSDPVLLVDAYVYHHTGNDVLQCLALSAWGGIHAGAVSVLKDGAIQLDLKCTGAGGAIPHIVRFDRHEGGMLRHRTWTAGDSGRTLVLDLEHHEVAPK